MAQCLTCVPGLGGAPVGGFLDVLTQVGDLPLVGSVLDIFTSREERAAQDADTRATNAETAAKKAQMEALVPVILAGGGVLVAIMFLRKRKRR